MTAGLEKPHLDWLEARGISADLAAKFNLHTSEQMFPPEAGSTSDKWTKAKCISVPYQRRGKTFNHKHRRTSVKQHVMDKGAPLGLWNEEALDRAAGGTWVITEGEWDAITAEGLGWAASSVPNGANDKVSEDVANAKRYEFLWDVKDKIAAVERVVIATDGDAAGICLRTDLIALFGPVKSFFVEYPDGCKDLNDVRVKYGIGGGRLAGPDQRQAGAGLWASLAV
jgi:twinkle protein